MSKRKKLDPEVAIQATSILNITWELKDHFTRFQKRYSLQKVAIGTLSGKECVYLMLKDGRRVRVRIEEVTQQPANQE